MTFDLSKFDGLPIMTYDDVALRLGIPRIAVQRAIKKFREKLLKTAIESGYIDKDYEP